VWHARPGNVNLNSIRWMMCPNLSIDLKHKCEICVQSKQPRKSFSTHMKKKKTNLFELNWVTERKIKLEFCFIW